MSLIGALRTATSGLRAVQTQISVVSNNLTNADVAGYTKKTVSTESVIAGGVGSGVTVTAITSNVDQNLLKTISAANSTAGAAAVKASYLANAETILGTTSSETSVANEVGSLASELSTLASNPESVSQKSNVVNAASNLAQSLSSMTDSIQQLRGQADQQIASDVSSVNTDLDTINDLNMQIARTQSSGQPTADLSDKLNSAISDLSTKLDINYYTDGSGRAQIYTTAGNALVDSSVHHLSYNATSSVSTSTTYGGSTGFQGIMLGGKDITTTLRSGEIKGLIDLRDTDLVSQQNQVNNLATTLASTVNAAANTGTSFPPPATLTGSVTTAAGNSFSGTGTVRVAVLGSDGTVQSSQDLNLASYSTVGQVVAALNGISGLSASVNSSGNLTVSATATGSGVSIGAGTSAVGGKSFSSYFGLNDLFVSSGAGQLAVRSDIANAPSLLQSATLSTTTPLTAGSSGVAVGDNSIANALSTVFTTAQTFAAAGGIGATKTTLGDYASTVVSTIATASSNAQATSTLHADTVSQLTTQASNEDGVNTDEETAELTVLQNSYSATANIISTVEKMFTDLMTMVSSTS